MKPSNLSVEERLLKMYTELWGEPVGSCYLEVDLEDNDNEYSGAIGIKLMKDGNLCANYTKADIVFEYVTADWSKV